MKIYRVCFSDDSEDSPTGSQQLWHKTKASAKEALKELKANGKAIGYEGEEIDTYNIDPTRAGIVEFLNQHAKLW